MKSEQEISSGMVEIMIVTSDDVDPEPTTGKASVVTVPSGRLLRKHYPWPMDRSLNFIVYVSRLGSSRYLQNGFNLLVVSISVIGS